MSERGKYRSREETRERLVEAGVEFAADRPAVDAFAHIHVASVARDAGTSTTSVHRQFDTVEGFRQALLGQIITEAMEATVAELGEEVREVLEKRPTLAEICRVVPEANLDQLIEDNADQYQVAMAALSANPAANDGYQETDAAALEVMEEFYRTTAHPLMGVEPSHGLTYGHLAMMTFAMADGLAMWTNVAGDELRAPIGGPDDVEVDGPWQVMGLGIYALYNHLTRERVRRTESELDGSDVAAVD